MGNLGRHGCSIFVAIDSLSFSHPTKTILAIAPESLHIRLLKGRDTEALEELAATGSDGDWNDESILDEVEKLKESLAVFRQNMEMGSFSGKFVGRGSCKLHFARRF